MKVILTEKVPALGNVGEIVNVSAGYGRNYLVPKNLAVIADDKNKKAFENQKKALAKKVAEEYKYALDLKKKIDGLNIELVKKVGNNGKLFGSVTNSELSKILSERTIEIERRLLIIETPIKSTGTFNVKAKLFPEVEANFTVKVTMDPVQAEEMKKKQEAAIAKKAKAKADAEAQATDEATAEEVQEEVQA
ncbi:MAG: 50S ribosomal protein L9 [Halobacteriovoraceae bacterium]|nr:50S ribosomal protein L9 [Halobacteriovoraceae bacterium]